MVRFLETNLFLRLALLWNYSLHPIKLWSFKDNEDLGHFQDRFHCASIVIVFALIDMVRDRPFNLQGGGYGFLFRSENFFQTTQELEYNLFSQNLTLGYMTKTLNQIIFFFLHQNQNIFSSIIGNQNIFLEKNHIPPGS